MSNKTGKVPSNGHRIQGRSSESFIDAREVLSKLELQGDEVFLDAGCGDGHVSFLARELLDKEAIIYAVDNYEPSIEDMQKDVEVRGITNILPILGDITSNIPLDNDSVNVALLINVFHHFLENTDEAITELKRVTKPGGKIAIMDYKKMDTGYGPPLKYKQSPEEVEKMFQKQGLEMVQLDNEVGEDLEGGVKSHYLIVFQKK